MVFFTWMEMPKGIKHASGSEVGIKTVHKWESFWILGAETLQFMLSDGVVRILRQYVTS